MTARRRLFGDYGFLGSYRRHPDPRQETLFWALLREMPRRRRGERGVAPEEMERGHLRHDALEHLATAPTVEAVLGDVEVRRAA